MMLGLRANLHQCQPGDVINSPKGEPMYAEPKIHVAGWEAHAFLLKGAPVGVLVLRPGQNELRYCDREGIVHREPVHGGTYEALMMAGIKRMAELIATFLGERHPLADMPSAGAA